MWELKVAEIIIDDTQVWGIPVGRLETRKLFPDILGTDESLRLGRLSKAFGKSNNICNILLASYQNTFQQGQQQFGEHWANGP